MMAAGEFKGKGPKFGDRLRVEETHEEITINRCGKPVFIQRHLQRPPSSVYLPL